MTMNNKTQKTSIIYHRLSDCLTRVCRLPTSKLQRQKEFEQTRIDEGAVNRNGMDPYCQSLKSINIFLAPSGLQAINNSRQESRVWAAAGGSLWWVLVPHLHHLVVRVTCSQSGPGSSQCKEVSEVARAVKRDILNVFGLVSCCSVHEPEVYPRILILA